MQDYSLPSLVVGVRLEVELANELGAVEGIGNDSLKTVIRSSLALGFGVRSILSANGRKEGPPQRAHEGMHDGDVNEALETLQLTGDQSPVSPCR